jgi:hypothetical protein
VVCSYGNREASNKRYEKRYEVNFVEPSIASLRTARRALERAGGNERCRHGIASWDAKHRVPGLRKASIWYAIILRCCCASCHGASVPSWGGLYVLPQQVAKQACGADGERNSAVMSGSVAVRISRAVWVVVSRLESSSLDATATVIHTAVMGTIVVVG